MRSTLNLMTRLLFVWLQWWFWSGKPRTSSKSNKFEIKEESNKNELIEVESTKLHPGIEIKELTKIYDGTSKLAVNSLSLNFYEGQISAFLGHNGAGTSISVLKSLSIFESRKRSVVKLFCMFTGKTTTLSILSGFISIKLFR